jgi:hypothetical protein
MAIDANIPRMALAGLGRQHLDPFSAYRQTQGMIGESRLAQGFQDIGSMSEDQFKQQQLGLLGQYDPMSAMKLSGMYDPKAQARNGIMERFQIKEGNRIKALEVAEQINEVSRGAIAKRNQNPNADITADRMKIDELQALYRRYANNKEYTSPVSKLMKRMYKAAGEERAVSADIRQGVKATQENYLHWLDTSLPNIKPIHKGLSDSTNKLVNALGQAKNNLPSAAYVSMKGVLGDALSSADLAGMMGNDIYQGMESLAKGMLNATPISEEQAYDFVKNAVSSYNELVERFNSRIDESGKAGTTPTS